MNTDPDQPTLSALDALIAAAPDAPTAKTQPADLIPINRASGKPSVNARDLHTFLEVVSRFNDWIRNRCNDFLFAEGVDYEVTKNLVTGAINYTLSLDMAKELSMVERNDKGKQARQYFIECERVLLEVRQDPDKLLNDPSFLRNALLTNVEARLALAAEVAVLTPKGEAFDRLANADGLHNLTNSAKMLQIRPKELFTYVDCNGWTYTRPGTAERIAYQSRIAQGYHTIIGGCGVAPSRLSNISPDETISPLAGSGALSATHKSSSRM
ncbi:MAG: antA/AntB antirepressor family protein [Verrucomicrobiota bacterium]